MKLISMTDFVLQKANEYFNNGEYPKFNFRNLVNNYALFLKLPLTLGMFVPCNEEDNVLEEPTMEKYGYYFSNHQEEQSGWMYEEGEDEYYKVLEKYQQAKERVLFKNVTIIKASQNSFNIYIKKEISLVYDDNCKSFRAAHSIEDLANSFNKRNLNEFHIELTQSALKQIGL